VAAMVFDAEGLASTGFQNNLQLAQVAEFRCFGFIRREAFDAAYKIEQSPVVEIGIVVVFGFDVAVHEHQARRIGNAVIRGLVRLRPPLVRSIGHDFDGRARDMDVDVLDVVWALEERACFQGGLRHSLGELTKWKAFGEGSTNAERFAKLNRRYWLTPHHFEETVASFEDFTGTRHPILGELNSKEGLTASICSRIGLPVRQLIGAALARCRIAPDRNADRMHHLFGREGHEPPSADDGAHAGDRGMVDAIT